MEIYKVRYKRKSEDSWLEFKSSDLAKFLQFVYQLQFYQCIYELD